MSFPPPTPSRSSLPLTNISIVIIGGGPVGLLTAIHLHKRGLNVTLIEQGPDYNQFHLPKSYVLGLNWRGNRSLQSIPGLYDHTTAHGAFVRDMRIQFKDTNGKVKTIISPRESSDKLKNVFLLRSNLIRNLYDFARECKGIQLILGCSLANARFLENGKTELILTTAAGDESTIIAELVIACDGRNSSIGKAVDETASAEGPCHFQTMNGAGSTEVNSASTGMLTKSVVLSKDFLMNEPMNGENVRLTHDMALLPGRNKGKKMFRILSLRLADEISQTVGGTLGTIVSPADSEVWKLKTAEEGFQLFESNFPQLRVRQCIEKKNMEDFIATKPLEFGSVKRRKSLIISVGKEHNGAIIFLGDAAHSFPPDVGQGVNAGFEDVSTLMSVFDEAEDQATLKDLVAEYELRRGPDVEGLLRIARFGSPYQFGQDKIQEVLFWVNVMMRKHLSKIMPGIIHPAIIHQLGKKESYSEIARLVDTTTWRLKFATFSLLVVPTVGYVVSKYASQFTKP